MNPRAVRYALWVCVFGLCLLVSLPVLAQVAGATLSGTISDAQGGVLPNARVVVKDVATGTTIETTANATGAYNVPNLRPADYEVSASAMGFNTVMNKLTLTVGAKQELNFSLPVGQVTQVVTVTEAVPQIDTSSSTISGNVAAEQVRELPLNGRDWASLATLEPGVVEARTHLDVTHVGGGGGRGFGDQLSVSGSRPTQNSYRLDGALVNDYSNAGPGSVLGKNLGVDAIQEFSVLTSNYSAEYGFTSGGVINAVTRSGTNSFHGSAFEFLRNDKFDAANYFIAPGTPKNALRQNQFGASGGWRVLKDKLFLFGAYEGVRKSAGLPVTGNTTISDSVRAGNVVNLSTGSTVHVASIDPNIQKYMALFPHPLAGAAGCVPLTTSSPVQFSAPGVVGGCNPNVGAYNFVGNQHATENFFTARADYKISDKDSIFATYLRDPSSFTSPLAFNNELQFFSSYRQAIVTEETHVFNPAWVNSFRVAVDRTNNLGGNSPTAVNPAAGDASLGQLPGFFSSGVTLGNGITALLGGVGGGASIQDFWGQIFQVYDDAFHSYGNHSFKFGFAYVNYHVDGYTPLAGFNGAGSYSANGVVLVNSNIGSTPTMVEGNVAGGGACFNPATKGGATAANLGNGGSYDGSCGSLVNFLTNQAATASRPFASQAPDIVNKHYLRDNIFSGYFQDDWKFRSNLTLNLGLRYEVATIPTEINGEVEVMPSPTTILPCGSPVDNSFNPCPSMAAQIAGINQPTGDPATVLRNSFWATNPTTKNFEPRIGFAYDPFKNGKTAIRGGFGVFDALPLPYQLILNNTSAAPWRSTLAGMGSAVLPSPASIAGCAGTGLGAPGAPATLCDTTGSQGEWPYVVPTQTTQHITQPSGRSFEYVDNNIRRNYVFQYNLNVQRQITSTLSILVGYTGARAFHNPFQADSVNTIVPVLIPNVGYVWSPLWSNSTNSTQLNGFCPAGTVAAGTCGAGNVVSSRRLNPTTGSMYNTMYISKSYYDALQIKVDKRLSHGFQIQGSYTYSKSIDDSSGSTAGDTFQLDPVSEPWYDLRLDKGLSDFDIRHNLTINTIYSVPTAKKFGAIGERVLGGWQLGGIARVASGIPIPLVMGSDIAGEGTTTVNPPELLPGCSISSLVDPNYRQNLSYISGFYKSTGTACLGFVPLTAANAAYCDTSGSRKGTTFTGTVCPNIRGDLGRDTLIGPGLWDIDFSVFKNNKLTETTNLQFRAEMFNILNHVNLAPTSNTSLLSNTNGTINSTFGQITQTQGDNRIIQFALKLVW